MLKPFCAPFGVVAFVVGIGFHFMIAIFMKDLIFFSADEWRAIGAAVARRLDRAPVAQPPSPA